MFFWAGLTIAPTSKYTWRQSMYLNKCICIWLYIDQLSAQLHLTWLTEKIKSWLDNFAMQEKETATELNYVQVKLLG